MFLRLALRALVAKRPQLDTGGLPPGITLDHHAEKDLRGLDPQHRDKITDAFTELAASPMAGPNVKKLHGKDGLYRLRVGEYRVIYEPNGHDVTVRRICTRQEAYHDGFEDL